MSRAILVGRWLAFCVHPGRASRILPRPVQRLIVATWFLAAYAAVLAALLIARP